MIGQMHARQNAKQSDRLECLLVSHVTTMLSPLIGCLGRPPFDRSPWVFPSTCVCTQLLTFARQGIPPMGDDAAVDPRFIFVDSHLSPVPELWQGPPFQRVGFSLGSAARVWTGPEKTLSSLPLIYHYASSESARQHIRAILDIPLRRRDSRHTTQTAYGAPPRRTYALAA